MPRLIGHIQLITVGKLQQKHWKSAQGEYQKRLEWYTHFKLTEVKDAVGRSLPDNVALKKEGELLLKSAKDADRLIALTPTGRQMDSPRLAKYLQQQIQLYGRIAFIIGGPLGISDDVLVNCHEQISLSMFTFPHELARIILLEQLYRAFTIINGEKYHK